jgi:hypothetical protein
MTTNPKDTPDDENRPVVKPSASTQTTIDPISDKASTRETPANESELVGRLLYLDAFPNQSPERQSVAAGDAPAYFNLDGEPITSLDRVDPNKPIMAESINQNGQREITAYSNIADLNAGKPTARMVLETSETDGATFEKGTIFRGNTDEVLSSRAITHDVNNFDLTFQVSANGETQKVVFDGSGLPKQFELTRDGRTVQFKFDDAGNAIDVADSKNPEKPIIEPFRTMFLLAAKQSLDELRAAQGLPTPWRGESSNGDGDEYQPVSFATTDTDQPEVRPVPKDEAPEAAPKPREVVDLKAMSDKQLVDHAIINPSNAADVAAHLATLPKERQAVLIKALAEVALKNSDAAAALGSPQVAEKLGAENGNAFLKELFHQYQLQDLNVDMRTRFLTTASGFGQVITKDQVDLILSDTGGFLTPGNTQIRSKDRSWPEINTAAGKFVQAMFETNRSELHEPAARYLSYAGWGQLSPEGREVAARGVTALTTSPVEEVREFAGKAIAKLVETDSKASLSWLSPANPEAPGARKLQYSAIDGLFESGAPTLEATPKNSSTLLEVAKDPNTPESVKRHANALLLKMLSPDGLGAGDQTRHQIEKHLKDLWNNPEARTQLVRDAIYASSGKPSQNDVLAGLINWSKTQHGMPRQLTDEILKAYGSPSTMEMRGDYNKLPGFRSEIVSRALHDIPGALPSGAANMDTASMSFIEQAVRSGDKTLRAGARSVLENSALKSVDKGATATDVAMGRAALDTLVALSTGSDEIASEAQLALKRIETITRMSGTRGDLGPTLLDSYVRTTLASDHSGHRAKTIELFERQFNSANPQDRLEMLNKVIKSFADNVNGPGAKDLLLMLDRMERKIANAPADAPARTPEQVLAALAERTLGTANHPARTDMVRLLTGLSVQRTPYGEYENPVFATARGELARRDVYKNPELAGVMRSEIEKRYLPQLTSENFGNLNKLVERLPELKPVVVDMLANVKLPDRAPEELLYQRAFIRGGLAEVLKDTNEMTSEQSKEVLKIAVERLGRFQPENGVLTREQAEAIVDLTNRVYKEFGRDSETAKNLRKDLYEFYKESPGSKQAMADAFIRQSRNDDESGVQFFLTALRPFELEKQSPETLVENLPTILDRFKNPSDTKAILLSGSLEDIVKLYPGTKDAVAKWLNEAVKSDDPGVRDALLVYVARNGLDSFGKSDQTELSKTLSDSAFANLKSDNASIRTTARDALSQLVEASPEAARAIVPKLIEILTDKNNSVPENVKNDLLLVALHATRATTGSDLTESRKNLLEVLKPVIGNREALDKLMQAAASTDRNPTLSLNSLKALAGLVPDFKADQTNIVRAIVDAKVRHDKATENFKRDSYEGKARDERSSDFAKVFQSLGASGTEALKDIAIEQLKAGTAASALDILHGLSTSSDATVKKNSTDAVQTLIKTLDPAQLLASVGEDSDYNKLVQKELYERAQDPEKRSDIEKALLDHCASAPGKDSSSLAFKTLARILAKSPDSDPDTYDTSRALVDLARKDGPNGDRAFNAILAMALAPTDDLASANTCGRALLELQNDDKRKAVIQNTLVMFDLNTVDGVTALANVPRTEMFGKQIEERLQAVLKKHDPSQGGGENINPELFKAAFDGLLASNYSAELLRAIARPGESEAQVLTRLLPYLSAESIVQLRNNFSHDLWNQNVPVKERLLKAECYAALGTAGMERRDADSFGYSLTRAFDLLLQQNLSPDERQRLMQAGDAAMVKHLLASSNEQQQCEALSWFARRAQSGDPIPKEVVDKAMELVGNKEFAGSAAEVLVAIAAATGDAALTERINKRLIETAGSDERIIRTLASTIGREGFGTPAAREVLAQLSAQRPELIPKMLGYLLDEGSGRKTLETVSDIANKHPKETTQALSELYSQKLASQKRWQEPLNCLAMLMASENATVSGAAKTELSSLIQSPASKPLVLDALKKQYEQTGSEKLIGMIAGLSDLSNINLNDKQAFAELVNKAKTDDRALELLTFLAGANSPIAREAVNQLQQLAKTDAQQFKRVYDSLRTMTYGDKPADFLDSPAISLYINMSRNRINDPIVSGKLLKQNMLELVNQLNQGDRFLNLDENARQRLGFVLAKVAGGSTSGNYWNQFNAFVQKFSASSAETTPQPGQPVRVPETGKPGEAPPKEPFIKPDGTLSKPIWEGDVFKGYSEVAADKTQITRDAQGRITKVVSPQGVGREYIWGPQGFVTRIRESSGVEFSSSDGITYKMRPATDTSPTLTGELKIEPNGSYSIKSSEGTIRRDISGEITVRDGSDKLLQRIKADGSSILYNEYGQIVETNTAGGQTRKFKYENITDKNPSEVTEPSGSVFKKQPDKTWSDGKQTNTGDYSITDDGALVFKRSDGAKITDNLDGSHVEVDSKNRPTVVLTPNGLKREMEYTGDGADPTRITFSDKNGSTSWVRTATGVRPKGDSWKNEQTNKTWTEIISTKPDGTIVRTGGPESGTREVLLRPDGFEVGNPHYSNPKLAARTNPDGSKVLMNEAGQVVGLEDPNGHQLISINYKDGFISSVSDNNNNYWQSTDGKNWRNTQNGLRVGSFNIDETGQLRFTSDLTGEQIQHKTDGSIITRNNFGNITELVTANNRTFKFEYPPGSNKPNAYINGEGRWTTTDGGATWNLEAKPPNKNRTDKFTLDVNQVEGSLIQTMTDSKTKHIFLRDGHVHSVDAAGRITYNENPNGTWNSTTYNAQGQRERYQEGLPGVTLDTRFVTVDGQERLKSLETTNRYGWKRSYEFDPVKTTPPDGQPLVTSYRDEKGQLWRRDEGDNGHIYRREGGTEITTGVVKINRMGEFAQINQHGMTEIKNNGMRIETTKEPNTSKKYDARGLLVETVDYIGLKRTFTYNNNKEITAITEFDGQTERVWKANAERNWWHTDDKYGSTIDSRLGSYRLDQKTGQLTLEGQYVKTKIEYLTRQPCVIDYDQLSQIAKDIHKQIKEGGKDGARAIRDMLDPLTWEQRNLISGEFMKLYGDKYTGGLTEALKKEFEKEQVGTILDALNRKNDDPNYASLIKNTLLEYERGAWYNGTRTNYTCAKEIRDVLWRMNKEEFAILAKTYQDKYPGKSMRDAILDKITDEPDRQAMILLLDGAERGKVDLQAMINLGFEHRRIDLVRDALKVAPEEFRMNWLNDGGEQKIKDRFGANFWDYVCTIATVGLIDVYDRSRGYGIGSSRDVADLTDHARYGALGEATMVRDHTHWLGDNVEAIEHALNTMPDDRRQLYRMGLASAKGTSDQDLVKEFPHLAGLSPEARDFQIRNAKIFYADLEAAMKKAAGLGKTTELFELAKWRDLLLHPIKREAPTPGSPRVPEREPGTIVSRLAHHAGNIYNSNANDIKTTIENMSEGDWHYLHSLPEAAKQRILDEVSSMIGRIRPEAKDECLKMIREKMDAPTWEKAQATGRRDVLTVLEENKGRVLFKPELALDALQHMTDSEKQRLKDPNYRKEVQEKLVNALSMGGEAKDKATELISTVLDRIVNGGSALFTPLDRARQGVLETLNANEMSKNSEHPVSAHGAQMKAFQDIVAMLAKNPAMLEQYQKDPALKAQLKAELDKMSPGDKQRFVTPVMRMIQEGGFPPEYLKDLCGKDFQKLKEFLPRLTPAARTNLVNNQAAFEGAFGHLEWPQQQIMRNILQNNGEAKPEDIARAFVLKWGVDKGKLTQAFEPLDSLSRDNAYNNYFQKYGGTLDADLRKDIGGPMTQRLLARNETPEMQVQRLLTQYYATSDGLGAAFTQTFWDGTPAMARAQADQLIKMHAEASRMFENLKRDPKFEDAVKALDKAIQMMRESKAGAADALSNALITIGAIALSGVTGGASLIVLAAVLGAAVKVGVNMTMMGADGYSRQKAISDILTGGLEGVLNVLGPGHVARIFGMTAKTAETVSVAVGQKFATQVGPHVLADGAEATIRRELTRELGSAVATGSHNIPDKTLEAIAKQALKEPTAQNIERLVLLMKSEIKDATVEQVALSAKMLLKEMGIHGLTGGGAGFAGVTGETLISAATGQGTWDPHLTFNENFQRYLMAAGTATLIGGAAGSGFHGATRILGKAGGSVFKGKHGAEFEGLEKAFHGASPEVKAQTFEKMVDWAQRSPVGQREAAFNRVREIMGITKETWATVFQPIAGKSGATAQEIQNAAKLARACNSMDQSTLSAMSSMPPTQRLLFLETLAGNPKMEGTLSVFDKLPAAQKAAAMTDFANLPLPQRQLAMDMISHAQPGDQQAVLRAVLHNDSTVLRAVESITDPAMKARALAAFGHLDGTQRGALISVLGNMPDTAARGRAMEAFGRLPREQQGELLGALQHMSREDAGATLGRFANLSESQQAQLAKALGENMLAADRSNILRQVLGALDHVPAGEKSAALDAVAGMNPQARARFAQRLRDIEPPSGSSVTPDAMKRRMMQSASIMEAIPLGMSLEKVAGLVERLETTEAFRTALDKVKTGISKDQFQQFMHAALLLERPVQGFGMLESLAKCTPAERARVAASIEKLDLNNMSKKQASEALDKPVAGNLKRMPTETDPSPRGQSIRESIIDAIENERKGGGNWDPPLTEPQKRNLREKLSGIMKLPDGEIDQFYKDMDRFGIRIGIIQNAKPEEILRIMDTIKMRHALAEQIKSGKPPEGLSMEQAIALNRALDANIRGDALGRSSKAADPSKPYLASMQEAQRLLKMVTDGDPKAGVLADLYTITRQTSNDQAMSFSRILDGNYPKENLAKLRDYMKQVTRLKDVDHDVPSELLKALKNPTRGELADWVIIPAANGSPAEVATMDGLFMNMKTGEVLPVNFKEQVDADKLGILWNFETQGKLGQNTEQAVIDFIERAEKGGAILSPEMFTNVGGILPIGNHPPLTPVQRSQLYHDAVKKAVDAAKALEQSGQPVPSSLYRLIVSLEKATLHVDRGVVFGESAPEVLSKLLPSLRSSRPKVQVDKKIGKKFIEMQLPQDFKMEVMHYAYPSDLTGKKAFSTGKVRIYEDGSIQAFTGNEMWNAGHILDVYEKAAQKAQREGNSAKAATIRQEAEALMALVPK